MATIDVSAASILGNRGIRYKRNTLAASLIATVLYWTSAPFGEVSLFGVSLTNVEDKEAVAWMIFFVILSYQWVMLAYYGWTDWRIWQQRVRQTFNLSPRNIAYWMKVGAVMWDDEGGPSNLIVYETKVRPNTVEWSARDKKTARSSHFSHSDRENIRWRLTAFLTTEFGLPFLWGLACLYLALSKIFG